MRDVLPASLNLARYLELDIHLYPPPPRQDPALGAAEVFETAGVLEAVALPSVLRTVRVQRRSALDAPTCTARGASTGHADGTPGPADAYGAGSSAALVCRFALDEEALTLAPVMPHFE